MDCPPFPGNIKCSSQMHRGIQQAGDVEILNVWNRVAAFDGVGSRGSRVMSRSGTYRWVDVSLRRDFKMSDVNEKVRKHCGESLGMMSYTCSIGRKRDVMSAPSWKIRMLRTHSVRKWRICGEVEGGDGRREEGGEL